MDGIKVLVTGSTGFVGSNLCRGLLSRGATVRAFHRPSSSLRGLDGLEVAHVLGDLTQPETLEAAMQGVEVVFHAAAWMGSSDQAGRQYAVTVEGTRSVLEAARRTGVRRVVHTSSAAALGIPAPSSRPEMCIDERHTWNYRPDFYPYGYAKYLAELEVQKAVARGLDVVIVNPTLIFGAGDVYRQGESLITLAADRRITVAVAGGVNCIHVADVVDGQIAALEHGKTGERYILGGENLTYLELLRLLAEATGAPAPNQMLPTGLVRALAGPAVLLHSFVQLPVSADLLRLAGVYFFYDTTRAKEQLRLEVPRPVRDAIAEGYAWFRQAG
jgi:dihydroflavonol-4-reductase